MSEGSKFPDGTRYVSCLTPPIVDGRANMRKYFATNSNADFTYAGTNEIRIEVTADRGAMLNGSQGYLEFTMEAVTRNLEHLDGGAWCWIDEFAITSDGQDIERISGYNLLHTVLSQYTSNVSHMIQENILSGSVSCLNSVPEFVTSTSALSNSNKTATVNSNVFTLSYINGDGTNAANAISLASSGGRSNYDPFQTTYVAASQSRVFTIPLVSGFLGSGLYCPVGESRGFTIYLRLAPDMMLGNWQTDATGTYKINTISYNVPVITIEDSVFRNAFNNMLRADGSNAVCWRGTTYRHYVSTLNSTSGGDATVIINDRSRSLSAMFCVLRTTNTGLATYNRMALSTRTITQINSFQIRIGDVLFPNTQINIKAAAIASAVVAGGRADQVGRGLGEDQNGYNVSRAYAEVAKMFGLLHNTMTGGLIGLDSYGSDEGLDCADTGVPSGGTTDNKALSHYGTGILGVDLQSYSGDSSASGIDTARNNLNVTLLFNLKSIAITYQVDTYSVCNAIYRLDGAGTFSSSY